MSQTIDQLLTDVSPLLPVESVNTDNTKRIMYSCALHVGPDFILDDDTMDNFDRYMRHAANKFPAMLQALREGSILIANRNYAEAFGVLQKAIAAACEVGQ